MCFFKCNVYRYVVACGVAQGSQPGAPVGRFLNAAGDFGGASQDFYRPAAMFCEKMRVHEAGLLHKLNAVATHSLKALPGFNPW
jgi:hypothetical protein